MSETGQPGAATPGEHGDGTGQQDDLARSVSGWAPPATGWSGGADAPAYRDTVAPWHRPDPATGWDASSPRHGDLPAPLTDPEPDPAPRNGRAHLNGVGHPGEEPRGRPSPVSAPPADAPRFGADLRRDADGDRLVVPAQRPAPSPEQQSGSADPDAPARHSSEEPPRLSRWADGGLPTSAPPAVQVPPVGTAASGFEIPPGFHAPRPERGQPDRAEADEFPPDVSRARADRPHPGSADESTGARGGDEAAAGRGEPDPHAEQPYAGHRPADEPDWSGPSWNRPSWGGGWAPPWAREDEPPTSRRSRSDRTPEWSAEPDRPYEPVRAEPARPYEPVRAEPARPYEPVRSEEPRPYEPTRAEREARAEREPSTDRPAPDRSAVDAAAGWAGSRSATAPPSAAPRSAPPAAAPASAPPVVAPASAPPAAAPASAPPAAPPYGERPAGTAYGASPASGSYGSAPSAGSYGSAPSTEPSASAAGSFGSAPGTGWYSRPEPSGSYRTAPSTGSYGSTPTPAPPAEAPAAAPRSAPPAAAPRSAPPAAAPRSAPPAGAAAPYSAPPAPAQAPAADSSPTTDWADRPFRLRSVPAETASAPAELPHHQPTPTGPGAAPDPATSGPRRLDRPSSAPAPTSAPPYAARRSAPDPAPPAEPAVEDGTPEPGAVVLPQRVPAEPDVPVVPEPPAVEPPAETPELARIATHLRRDDEPAPLRERPEGFDVNAILDAVREVAGVRDAALRRTPAGAHSLRLDLADGADPAEVSRMVARLLQERMGLAAAPQNLPGTTPAPAPMRRRSAETRAPEPRAPETRAPEPRGAEPRPGEASARPRDAESRPGDLRRQEPGAGPSRRSRSADPSGEGRAPAGTGRGVADQPPGAHPAAEAATAAPAPGRVEDYPGTVEGVPRRRRQVSAHRGRASVEEASAASAPPATGSPATLGTSYSGGQLTTTESAPSRPLDTGGAPGPRVVIDHVQVSTFGLDATVEVRLLAGGEQAAGHSSGPAVDGYVLRLCAVAAAAAVDQLLRGADGTAERGRCFVEHAAVVPFGNCEVATVVVLLVCDGWVEQLAGSALVAGDPRQAVVRATLAAVNRRLEALLG
ncbi:hypothetical protein M2302_001296 [Micromonospora sp. A200]|uniref:hypothetical protein n=1 Tax=Micromonospora sp. A200 TaxID=2940568 RepID=UPI0024740BA4|nr:hypothetical protein [Micromonospora sp. A200]MDH6461130.1 hypothetical protein [Micromonospora sp. A200]